MILPNKVSNETMTTSAQQWIADWSNNKEPKPIAYQAFETLAIHRIADIAMSLIETDTAIKSSSKPTAIHLSDSDEITEARKTLFTEIFKGRDEWGVSTVLDSIRSDITKCMDQSKSVSSIGGVVAEQALQSASKLAHSALHNKTKAEGFNALFNIEITAALLKYILTKVCDLIS
jgi:hypothetical protein